MKINLDFPQVLRALITFSHPSLLQTDGEQPDAKGKSHSPKVRTEISGGVHITHGLDEQKTKQETATVYPYCISLGFTKILSQVRLPKKIPELKSASSRGHYCSQNISSGVSNVGSHKVKHSSWSRITQGPRYQLGFHETQDELLHCMFPVESWKSQCFCRQPNLSLARLVFKTFQ